MPGWLFCKNKFPNMYICFSSLCYSTCYICFQKRYLHESRIIELYVRIGQHGNRIFGGAVATGKCLFPVLSKSLWDTPPIMSKSSCGLSVQMALVVLLFPSLVLFILSSRSCLNFGLKSDIASKLDRLVKVKTAYSQCISSNAGMWK
jgi:hypothetical protein